MVVHVAPPWWASAKAVLPLSVLLSLLSPAAVDAVLMRSRGTDDAAHRATPVEKVVQLLKKLSADVAAEGKTEAAQYDKFACFCKEQADEKLYAVEKSTKKLDRLNATITKLDAEINELNAEIVKTSASIQAATEAKTNATSVRNEEHMQYEEEAEEIANCISALKSAIQAMQSSKTAMTSAKLNLPAVASRVLSASGGLVLLSEQQVKQLQGLKSRQQPPVYTYGSNDVITTLQDLLSTFKKHEDEAAQTERTAQHAFELKSQALANEVKFAQQDKLELEKVVATKEEESNSASQEQLEETQKQQASQAFLQELTGECEEKGKLWDQRSTTRSEELQVLNQAITALETGVAPKYGANKKLVDLQTKPGHSRVVEAFVQVHQQSSIAGIKKQQLIEQLAESAGRLRSPELSMLVMKVQSSNDPFVKVRSLIKDLLTRLSEDKTSEAQQKEYCDKHMKEAISTRDAMAVTLEAKAAEISVKSAKVKQLQSEVADLSDEISNLKKALMEATELRAEESGSNQQTLSEATEGKKAVDFALTLLKEFYNDMSLAQLRKTSQPAGETAKDAAPEVFEDEYKGKQDASSGIIGLLQVIATDFERTLTTVSNEEEAAASSFETFKTDTEADIKASQDLIDSKGDEIVSLTAAITELKEEQSSAGATRQAALKELESLRGMCVDGEESWNERAASREKEIEALKEALRTLDEWQH